MLLSSLKVRDREYLIALLLDYHCIIKPKAAIDQFIEGLQCSGIMHYVKCYPDVLLQEKRTIDHMVGKYIKHTEN